MKMVQVFGIDEDDKANEFAETVGGKLEYSSFEVKVIWNGRPSDIEEFRWHRTSATAGDYSPSCPWNAEGMSVSDFI